MKNQKIKIELTKDEALVLFELVSKLNGLENFNQIEDQSEKRVLWNIEAILEKELSEPFNDNYNELVQQAKNNIRDKEYTHGKN